MSEVSAEMADGQPRPEGKRSKATYVNSCYIWTPAYLHIQAKDKSASNTVSKL